MSTAYMSKLRSYWQKHGAAGTAKKLLRRGCQPILSCTTLNLYSMSEMPPTTLQSRCALDMREGTREDVGLFREVVKEADPLINLDMPEPRTETTVCERANYLFDTGAELFFAFCEGKVASFVWVHYWPGISQACPHIKMREDEAYLGYGATLPAFRGKNIMPVLLQHTVRHILQKGIPICFASTASANKAMIKG